MTGRPIIPDDVWAMPGRELLASLEGLGSMLRVFRRNSDELSAWLSRTDDVRIALTLWNATDRRALDHHLDEAVRLLFNFVASAVARVDHYRVVKNRGHLTGELHDAYEQRVASFAEDGMHRWFVGVRQFMLHHRLPITRSRFRMTRSEHDEHFEHRTTVVLPTEELASDRRSFDTAARRWMSSRNDIDLRAVVAEYDEQVREFDDWFGPAFASHHVDPCDAFIEARAAALASWERRWDGRPGD